MTSLSNDELAHIVPALRHLAVPIESLNPDPANARLHPAQNLAVIKSSLARFGQDQPLVVQKQGLVIRKGNGRFLAAKALGWKVIAALVVDESDVAAVARAIADNRSSELAVWDEPTLAKLLVAIRDSGELETETVGFSPEQVQALIGNHSGDVPDDPGPQTDRATELQKKWQTTSGQLWVIPSKTVPPRKVVTCPHCDCEQEV